MNQFMNAMNNTARTENGMVTNISSMNSLVDLFFKIGASRGRFENIKGLVEQCASEDLKLTVSLLLWARDAREGAGERQLFRDAIRHLIELDFIDEEGFISIIHKTAELGRFDDILSWYDTKYGEASLVFVAHNMLASGNQLAAKWTPRKGPIFNAMRKMLGVSPKMLRKHLVQNTNVVETLMCNKEFTQIDFSKVPSVAMSRYLTAFHRNAPEQFVAYRESLVKGETKINAGAVYPYTIINAVKYGGDDTVASEQWKALPNYMEGVEGQRILPVVDTSGSMERPAGGYGSNSKVTCMDVAVSLGLYIAERNEGPYKDHFVTFSSRPSVEKIVGRTLKSRYRNLSTAHWGTSTNLELTMKAILDKSVKFKVPQEDMPTSILILSDMQFNQGVQADVSSLEMIKTKYKEAGYEMPKIVYWNIFAANGVPATVNDYGVGLVSGFSPSIMKSILQSGTTASAEELMMETIGQPRYYW